MPGALSAKEIKSEEIPSYALEGRFHITPEIKDYPETDHFSLSGVLMKFSLFQIGDAFHISKSKNVGIAGLTYIERKAKSSRHSRGDGSPEASGIERLAKSPGSPTARG